MAAPMTTWLVFSLALLLFSVSISSVNNPRANSESASPAPDDDDGQEPQLVTLVSLATSDGGGGGGFDASPSGLQYDFYRDTCPDAEAVIRSKMTRVYARHRNVTAQLLRLFFHDCFIKGCDASVLLDDSKGNKNHSIEKQATPNKSLRGFQTIDLMKESLEKLCPGVVSCADIVALATRDGIVLADGPFYPLMTGRRDSNQSYFDEAMEGIPRPDDNITQTLNLFSQRGFNDRETVVLLGGHNIGKIGCEFIKARLNNFKGTGQPDPTLPPAFLNQMRLNCQDDDDDDDNKETTSAAASPLASRGLREKSTASKGMSYFQQLSSSMSSGDAFDTHYYKSLVQGRGLLFADQQLMANKRTARLVAAYASDDGSAFRRDFARALMKMSALNVLTGSEGQVRRHCSLPVYSS